jgi:hypothetical protein
MGNRRKSSPSNSSRSKAQRSAAALAGVIGDDGLAVDQARSKLGRNR